MTINEHSAHLVNGDDRASLTTIDREATPLVGLKVPIRDPICGK
jgi:hypothetical protein